jgi:HEAT repeat protein
LLGTIGPPADAALPALTGFLTNANSCTKQKAALAIWQISHSTERVLPVLEEMLTSTNVAEHRLAAAALSEIKAGP